VLFDSWYASKKLIKFCRKQKWHVICAIKSNRRINKVGMSQHNQTLRHRPYERITLEAVDEHRKAPRYYTRFIKGYLEDFAEPVHAIISKTRPGDKFPKYFVCTDLSLSVQQALRYYQKRWSVEVDNLYLKNALGLGDFRLQSFEAIEKWFAVVVLAINYLQYRMRWLTHQTFLRLPWRTSSVCIVSNISKICCVQSYNHLHNHNRSRLVCRKCLLPRPGLSFDNGLPQMTMGRRAGSLPALPFLCANYLPFLWMLLRFTRQLWRN